MNKNIYKLLIVSIVSILFVQCGDGNKFIISKGKVGELTTVTTINDLDKIFKNDSIVKNLSEGALGNNYFQDDDEYIIYEKGGKHLLTIIPQEQLDSTSTIKSIQIFDPRFSTKSGISLNSSFDEEAEAEFVRNFFLEWQDLKIKIKNHLDYLSDLWAKESEHDEVMNDYMG